MRSLCILIFEEAYNSFCSLHYLYADQQRTRMQIFKVSSSLHSASTELHPQTLCFVIFYYVLEQGLSIES